MTLPNGIRLIVQPESISHTVVVAGEIENNEDLQVPPGQEGVADVTAGLLPFGTTTYDRIAFQTELDKIAGVDRGRNEFRARRPVVAVRPWNATACRRGAAPRLSAGGFCRRATADAGRATGEMTTPQHLADVALNKALYPPGDPVQRFATPKERRSPDASRRQELVRNGLSPRSNDHRGHRRYDARGRKGDR